MTAEIEASPRGAEGEPDARCGEVGQHATPKQTKLPRVAYAALVGRELGVSRWIEITQGRIDQFAACTGDRQYIHVDPQRAAASPFGTTVAHGFLTLSMIPEMMTDIPAMAEVETSMNYGLNRLRFIAPVPVGSRVRGRFLLASFDEIEPDVVQTAMTITVEIEAAEKPALVAEWLARRYLRRDSEAGSEG